MEQPRHTQQIYHGKNLDLIPASISFILVKRQNGYKIGGEKTTKKKVRIISLSRTSQHLSCISLVIMISWKYWNLSADWYIVTPDNISLIFTSPALHSFTPSFLKSSTELRVLLATPYKVLPVHHAF